jgi:hypothetical protein
MSLSQAKVPILVTATLLALAGGVAIGAILGMTVFHEWNNGSKEQAGAKDGNAPGPPGGMFGPGGGAKGKGKGGGKGPGPKMQLNTLIEKLDLLTTRPLTLTLDAAQKKQIREQLEALSQEAKVSDEDAQKRLDALLAVLKDQKEPLAAVGFRWPGADATPGPPLGMIIGMMPNPFRDGPTAGKMKSLEARLAK